MSSSMHFDASFSFEKSVHIIGDLLPFFVSEASPISHLFSKRDWKALSHFEIEPSRSDWTPSSLKGTMQAAAFFSKNASLPLDIDVEQVALTKFLESEEICRSTNSRFRNRSIPFSEGGMDAGLIFEVQRKIAGILGPFPGVCKFNYGFGPGANVGLSRFTSVRRKLSTRPTCTAGAWKYLPVIQEYSPHWTEKLEKALPVAGGKYASVPKNAKTNRSILIEPLINSYLQKGVGSYIRDKLMVAGLDLSDQSFNQHLALLGSISGDWATIDLAAASDTISREVVKELLPCDWWFFLEDIRSQFAVLPDGREIYLQKFSSMGNGFTFELETLIFFAIASVVSDQLVQVYGDDIVVRSCDFQKVITALNHFGFSVNPDKSFCEGNFRESCGRDYLGGVSVRPCYVKGKLSVKELFRLHNFFIRDDRADVAKCVLKHIPLRFRTFGPDGFGDGHLLGDHPRTLSKSKRRRGWGGYTFRTYQTKPLVLREELSGDYAAFLLLSAQQASSWWDPGSEPPSSSMYQERGASRYVTCQIYTYA